MKQHLKRLGLTITDIEQQQDILRDSLNFYRTRLETAPKTASRSIPARPLQKFLKKPANLFDWIIIITGIVAVFSGLMLLISVTRAFSRKRRPRHRTPETIKQAKHPSTIEKPVPPAPAYPDIATESSPPPAAAMPTAPDIGVTQLQRRIERYQATPGTYDAPQIPELPPLTAPPPTADEVSDTASIESRVVAASRSGLDVAAISRKFQLSSDHVALILKMAGQNPPSR